MENKITQQKTGKGLLQEPIKNFFQTTSSKNPENDEGKLIKDAINEFVESNKIKEKTIIITEMMSARNNHQRWS